MSDNSSLFLMLLRILLNKEIPDNQILQNLKNGDKTLIKDIKKIIEDEFTKIKDKYNEKTTEIKTELENQKTEFLNNKVLEQKLSNANSETELLKSKINILTNKLSISENKRLDNITFLNTMINQLSNGNDKLSELMKDELNKTRNDINNNKKDLDNQLSGIDKKIDDVKKDTKHIDEKLDVVDTKLDEIGNKLDDIQVGLNELSKKRDEFEDNIKNDLDNIINLSMNKNLEKLAKISEDESLSIFYQNIFSIINLLFFDAKAIQSCFIDHNIVLQSKKGKIINKTQKVLKFGSSLLSDIPFIKTIVGGINKGVNMVIDKSIVKPRAANVSNFNAYYSKNNEISLIFGVGITLNENIINKILQCNNDEKKIIKLSKMYGESFVNLICNNIGKELLNACNNNCDEFEEIVIEYICNSPPIFADEYASFKDYTKKIFKKVTKDVCKNVLKKYSKETFNIE